MRAFFISILFFFELSVSAQTLKHPYVLVDRFCNCPEMEWSDHASFELKDISRSENDVEIRLKLYTSHSYSMVDVVLSRFKGVYSAYLYYKILPQYYCRPDSIKKYGKWEMYPYIKYQIDNDRLDTVYNKLIKANVNGLPNLNSIYKGPFISSIIVTCKINGAITSYRFGSIEKLIRENPGIDEFKKYQILLKIYDELVRDYFDQAIEVSKTLQNQQKRKSIE